MRRLALLALVIAPSLPRPSGACDTEGPTGGAHRLDPQHSTDLTPPSAVNATSVDTYYHDPDSEGCGSSCSGDYSRITLHLVASDDRTAPELLGYRMAIVGGDLPDGLEIPRGTVLAKRIGEIDLPIRRGGRTYHFSVEIRAVDLNGNVGPPSIAILYDRQ